MCLGQSFTNFISENLKFIKLCSHCVPKVVTEDHRNKALDVACWQRELSFMTMQGLALQLKARVVGLYGWEVSDHPPYNHDLVLSNYYLFHHFNDHDKVKMAKNFVIGAGCKFLRRWFQNFCKVQVFKQIWQSCWKVKYAESPNKCGEWKIIFHCVVIFNRPLPKRDALYVEVKAFNISATVP